MRVAKIEDIVIAIVQQIEILIVPLPSTAPSDYIRADLLDQVKTNRSARAESQKPAQQPPSARDNPCKARDNQEHPADRDQAHHRCVIHKDLLRFSENREVFGRMPKRSFSPFVRLIRASKTSL